MLSSMRFRRVPRWLAVTLALLLAAYWVPTLAVTAAQAASTVNVDQYDQCETGNPAVSDGKCADWTHGILNGTHDVYHEDEVTPQRLVATFDTAGTHTIDISYLTFDAGVHAYDSLATWNFTRTGADRCQSLSTGVTCVGGTPGTPSVLTIPLDTSTSHDAGTGISLKTFDHQLTGQQIKLYGGTLTAADYMGLGYYAPEYQTLRVTLSTTSPSTQVMLLFGGHIAAAFGPRGWGAGLGASGVPGGSYHIRITAIDGSSAGNRDNQLMSSAIAPATGTTITTTATTSTAVGQAIGDSATVSPPSAQGTVTFVAYGPDDKTCSGRAAFTSSQIAVTNGTASTSGFTPTMAGTYRWIATFVSADDSKWTSVSGRCGDAGETSTVNKTQPSIVTSASNAVLGSDTVADVATVSGLTANATGDVTFKLYGPSSTADCSGTEVYKYTYAIGTVTNGVASVTSGSFTPTAAGSYWWVASYSGDTNNAAVSGRCGDANEQSVVLTPPEPGLDKTAKPASGSTVIPGQQIDYTVTVSNTGETAISGGTVTDTLPSDVTIVDGSISNEGTYSSGQITWTVDIAPGGSVSLTYSVTVNSDAANGEELINTASFEQLTASTVHTVVVSSISTQATNAQLPAGSISDTATVSGLTAKATGDVTFKLYGPSSTADCSGTEVYKYTYAIGTVTNGVASVTSGSFTPMAAGSYWWVALYSGDKNNSPVSGKCGDEGEASTVSPASPTIVTSATNAEMPASITDVATVSGLTSNAGGTVRFALYGPSGTATCTGEPVFTDEQALGSVTNGAVTVTSKGYSPTSAGTYWWVASYSGDPNNAAVSGRCGDQGETSVVLTPANPGLTKTADPTSGSNVSRGQQIDYTVTVTNTGDVAISEARVTDVLPSYVTVVPESISGGGALLEGNIVWTVDVPANGSTVLTYSVTVNSDAPDGQQLVNTAHFGEMSARTTHTVVVPPPPATSPGTAGLTITKAVSPGESAVVNYGDTLTYTMTVTATGTIGQSDVTVTDHVPGYDPARTGSGVTTYNGNAACDGTCTVSYDSQSHLITWNLGSMSAGQVRTVTFTVTVDTPARLADGSLPSEQILNAAAVGSSQVATLPSNEVRNVVTSVEGLKIVKPSGGVPAATLPKTGPAGPVVPMAALAILLIGIGVGLTVATRRRTE